MDFFDVDVSWTSLIKLSGVGGGKKLRVLYLLSQLFVFLTEANDEETGEIRQPRRFFHRICTHGYFDLGISAVIFLNVICMAMEHFNQPEVRKATTSRVLEFWGFFYNCTWLTSEFFWGMFTHGILFCLSFNWSSKLSTLLGGFFKSNFRRGLKGPLISLHLEFRIWVHHCDLEFNSFLLLSNVFSHSRKWACSWNMLITCSRLFSSWKAF